MVLRILINHYLKYAAVTNIPEGGCRTLCGKPRSSSLGYVLGELGPNYPVPAVPLQVILYNSFIAVCEMNDPQYKYGAITLYPHN